MIIGKEDYMDNQESSDEMKSKKNSKKTPITLIVTKPETKI